MQLDKLIVDLRPRSSWESIDLGFRLAQSHYRILFTLWWITAIPVLGLGVLLLHGSPEWLALFVWWAKPSYEPLLVSWLGRALFGERLDLREVLASWRTTLLPRLAPNLLWRRFDLRRSLYMPITVLEHLRGKAWSKRAVVLCGHRSDGAWLTIAGAHFEALLELFVVFGVLTLTPETGLAGIDVAAVFSDSRGWTWVWSLAQLLAMSAIAPFYVASGFALYLTRRTELEGWDLELKFRRIAARLGTPLLFSPILLAITLAGVAEPVAATPVTPQTARTAAEEVLADKDFGRWKYVTTWVRKDRNQTDEKTSWKGLDLLWLARIVEGLLWLLAALGLGWLCYWILRLRRDRAPDTPLAPPPSSAVVLFDPGPLQAALPDNIPDATRALIETGEPRAALGLLYRAALVYLASRCGLAIPAAATEQECQSLVAQQRPAAQASYFARLTGHWIAIAYAHRGCADRELLGLCAEWERYFGRNADEP